MSLQFTIAKGAGALSTWGLKNVFRRNAGNFPGKIALKLDPSLFENLRSKMRKGSMLVVGTNGKTTTTNLIADALEADGQQVICNRGGANLDSGVATALLQADEADWGVFETDELWLAKILPHLQSNFVVLLDLFHDQMDRIAEIDTIQNSILVSLAASPQTVLLYNADDPNCAYIAKRTTNPTVGFGVATNMNAQSAATQAAEKAESAAAQTAESAAMQAAQNTQGAQENQAVHTATPLQLCQICGQPLEYTSRQYDQLGTYYCTSCDFTHPICDYEAHEVVLGENEIAFELRGPGLNWSLSAKVCGAYMVYNMTAVAAAANLAGCSQGAVQRAIRAFKATNGRLQTLNIQGHTVLTNLAKNPAGFDQNLAIIAQSQGPACAAFFVNDKEGDGRDTSWLWDINFEALAHKDNLTVFAGGIRALDLQLRLKYAGINARVVESVADVLKFVPQTQTGPNANDEAYVDVFLIANYTALPPVLAEAKELANTVTIFGETSPADSSATQNEAAQEAENAQDATIGVCDELTDGAVSARVVTDGAVIDSTIIDSASANTPVNIVELFPDVLNLFGDSGNARILSKRLEWRGIETCTQRITHHMCQDEPEQAIALIENADIICIGTGGSREMLLAYIDIAPLTEALHRFVNGRGVLLAVDSGFQLMGSTLTIQDTTLEGLSLVQVNSTSNDDAARMVGDIAGTSQLAQLPVIGYENHATHTHLSQACAPFVTLSTQGKHGNNDADTPDADGVLQDTLLGTYLHGPVLGKNPEVADALLSSALEHFRKRTGCSVAALAPLDDEVERAANDFMAKRLQG